MGGGSWARWTSTCPLMGIMVVASSVCQQKHNARFAFSRLLLAISVLPQVTTRLLCDVFLKTLGYTRCARNFPSCLSAQNWRTWRLETLLRELGLKSTRARTQMLVETSAQRRCGKQAGVHGWISETHPLVFMFGRQFEVMQTRGSTTVEGKNLAPLSGQALLTRSVPPRTPWL